MSGRGRNAAVATGVCLATLWTMVMPADAMPATVDYQCRPALPGGGLLSVDFNSGGKSISVQFPDGRSVSMPGRTSRSYFYYTGEHIKFFGTGQKAVTLTVMGQPARRCVASS